MKNSKIYYSLAAIIIAAPLIYMASIWNQIPETVPTHFNIEGQADRYGNKWELLIISGILLAVTVFVQFIVKLDPRKQNSETNMPRLRIVLLGISLFIAAVQLYMIQSAVNQGFKLKDNFILVAVSLLLALIGNYSQTIKPNYMFGIRTPWTLDNEEVWRQTHQICGKWMFYGGIICAVLLAILPFKIGFLVFITGTMLLVIGIFYTSYSLHKKIVHN